MEGLGEVFRWFRGTYLTFLKGLGIIFDFFRGFGGTFLTFLEGLVKDFWRVQWM